MNQLAKTVLGGVLLCGQALRATPSEGGWSDVPLPGPPGALAGAAGLGPTVERSRLLLEIIGRLQDGTVPSASASLDGFRRLPGSAAGETAPLPLGPALWSRVVFERDVPERSLLLAILGDRGASLLYRGLVSLDEATLRFLAESPGTLHRIRRGTPEAFSAFGRSLHVRDGRLVPPGGADSVRLWEALLGESLGDPSRCTERLLSRDEGRLAFFYDAVAHLNASQQAFALGRGLPDPEKRVQEFRRLYAAFARSETGGIRTGAPFARPAVDVARLLAAVVATPEGRWSNRLSRRSWGEVFGEGGEPDDEVSAAWLAERVGLGDSAVRSDRLVTVLFAQRVFPDLRGGRGGDVIEALKAVPQFPALALTLERMGIRDAGIYVRAARHAGRLASLRSGAPALLALAQFQGSLALLERARFRGTLDAPAGADLLSSLLDVPLSEGGGYQGALARWMEARLLPVLAAATGSEVDDPPELVVAQALSGTAPLPPRAPVLFRGTSYRLEPETAELLRLQGVRTRQGGPSLGEGLAFSHLGDGRPTGLTTWAEKVPRVSPAGRYPLEDLTLRGRAELGRWAAGVAPRPWLTDLLLTDALVSLVYAASLGPAEGPALVAGDIALRHDFGPRDSGGRGAWQIPRHEAGPGRPWHVRGSLLALDVGLATLNLRRLSEAPPAQAPTLPTVEMEAFAQGLALMNPVWLSDPDRDAIAGALGRGRQEVRRLLEHPEEADSVAARAGLDEWRRRALPWVLSHEPERTPGLFSLLEVFRLGRPEGPPGRFDPWGAPTVMLSDCLCSRLPGPIDDDLGGRAVFGRLAAKIPDLNLRVAEALAERRLPAALAPGVLAPLLQDFLDEAEASSPEDWASLTRRAASIPEERMDAYVASLSEGGGPLRGADAPGIP